MKKLLTMFLFALALAASAQAQTTVVTGTATDSQATPYILGTWTVNLKNTSSAQPTWQGSTSFQTSYSGSLDNTGAISVTLPSNTGTGAITVGGLTTTQWTFSICALDGGSCFTSSVTITGASQSITASLVNPGRITFKVGKPNQPPCGNGQAVVSVGASWGCSAGAAVGPVAGSDTQVQFNDAGVFGGDAGLTYNKTTDSLTAGNVFISAGKPWYDVTAFGAVGDGVADDTAAIQSVLNLVSLGGSAQNQGVTIFFPQGTYKITNTLFYEGGVSTGIHFLGEHGGTRGPTGARLWYQGPANGILFFGLAVNASDFDHIDFDGAGLTKYAVKLESTNEYSSNTVWNISSISRSSNLVTVTTTASHNLGSGDVVRIAGVIDASYNGTYLVSATDSATTFTFIQGGSSTSSSGGTATRYKSGPSSGVKFHQCNFIAYKSLLLTPTSVSRTTNVTTFTFSSPHFAVPGDTIYVTGMGNSTFNFTFGNITETFIASVPSSTTFTISDPQADASTSGGTVLLESSGLNIAHVAGNTEQVSELEVWASGFQGMASTQSMNGVKWNQGGNVKNFRFFGGVVTGSLFGFNGAKSGVFKVTGTIFATIEKADFFNIAGSMNIDSVESEPVAGARWVNNNGSGNNPTNLNIVGSTWQGVAGSDDIVISGGNNITLIANQLFNTRTGTSVAKVAGPSQLGNGAFTSLTSIENWYEHASSAAMPFQDGSGNLFFTSGSFHQNHSVSVTSILDQGGVPGGMVFLPSNIGSMSKIFSGTPNVTGNVVPFGGFINMQTGDSIQFRNNAASADVKGLSKDTNDIVQLGDTAGGRLIGPLYLNELSLPSGVANVALLTDNNTDHTVHFNANNNGDLSPSGAWSCTNVTPVTLPGTSTTGDQNLMACTIPAGTLNRIGRTLRVKAKGVYSTPAASVSQMTVKLKLCTVSGCGSGTVIAPINIQSTALGTVQITNDNFSLRSEITTQTAGASSAYEASGEFLIDLSTLTTAADSEFGDTNTATVGTIDSTAQLFLQTTIAFSVASASNVATQRQLIAETVN